VFFAVMITYVSAILKHHMIFSWLMM